MTPPEPWERRQEQPDIPKSLSCPPLSRVQIRQLTELVFHPLQSPRRCDAAFVFGGTHSGHWSKAIEAWEQGWAECFIVTGGLSPTADYSEEWLQAGRTESEVIAARLLEAGIPPEAITLEQLSGNTLENVLYARAAADFRKLRSLLVIGKAHTMGRGMRTLARHMPPRLKYVPYGFAADYGEARLSREEWMKSEDGRSRVYGEYARICRYGSQDHLLPPKRRIKGLEIQPSGD